MSQSKDQIIEQAAELLDWQDLQYSKLEKKLDLYRTALMMTGVALVLYII